MTHDEYQTVIADIMKGGDDVADRGAALLAAIDADLAASAEKDKKAGEDAETIKGLNDKINAMKVQEFLSKTGTPKPPDPSNEVDTILQKIINPHYGEEK